MDATVQIVKQFKKQNKIIVDFYAWDDSFANARNYGLSKVVTSWVLFIDADEILASNTDFIKLHTIINEFDDFYLKKALVICPYIIDIDTEQKYFVQRIFNINSDIHYFGSVHEELRSKDKELFFLNVNIGIYHSGYQNEIVIDKNKISRNIALLEKMLDDEPNNSRWTYMYVKDGFQLIDDKIKIELIKKAILKDCNNKISENNLKIDKYTYGLLGVLCKIDIKNGNFENIYKLTSLMETIKNNTSDVFYYRTLKKYIDLKKQYKLLLLETLEYRKENYDIQEHMTSTNGYHIDLLIAWFLFESGKFDSAKEYFEFLDNKFYDNNTNQVIKMYLDLLANV